MSRIRNLFLLLTLIGPLHMGEQLITGIDEFYMLRESLGGYYALFPAAEADRATVLLVTIVWTAVSLIFYAVLRGGVAALSVLFVFGLFGVMEVHHLIQAIGSGRYDPGVVTCVPYCWAGLLMVGSVWREYQRHREAGRVIVPRSVTV